MPKSRYVLAIDQGTTGTHVSIVDEKVKVVGKAYEEFKQHFPKPSWVEHDLNEIWRTVESCIAKALRAAKLKGQDIAAIGITNQRETTGAWTKDGKPLHRAIVWQDRRTSQRCAELKAQGEEARVREKTGLVLDPYFSGTKIEWLLANAPAVKAAHDAGNLLVGTIDSWLVYKLTAGAAHVTDVSNASRTLLMDLKTLRVGRHPAVAAERAARCAAAHRVVVRGVRQDARGEVAARRNSRQRHGG